MGTYATTTTLQLTMVGVNFSATNMSTLGSKAIEQAEAEVNKYLSRRYDISSTSFQTSTSVPPLVRSLTEQVAEGYMWRWMSRGGKEGMARGNGMIKSAQENLQAIADFKMHLLDTTGSVIADSANSAFRVQCNTTDYKTTFDEDSETAWAVDSDKLDDIANSRD